MPGHRKELAQAFLQKARNDLFTARSTLNAPDGPTDTPCFHAQQAAEKAPKALLASLGVSRREPMTCSCYSTRCKKCRPNWNPVAKLSAS